MMNAFDILADPTRRRMLELLREGESSVGALVDRLGMTQPAVSKQLRVLRDARVTSVRRDGRRRIYRLDPEGLRELDDWLRPFRVSWEERVDAMEDVLSGLEE